MYIYGAFYLPRSCVAPEVAKCVLEPVVDFV